MKALHIIIPSDRHSLSWPDSFFGKRRPPPRGFSSRGCGNSFHTAHQQPHSSVVVLPCDYKAHRRLRVRFRRRAGAPAINTTVRYSSSMVTGLLAAGGISSHHIYLITSVFTRWIYREWTTTMRGSPTALRYSRAISCPIEDAKMAPAALRGHSFGALESCAPAPIFRRPNRFFASTWRIIRSSRYMMVGDGNSIGRCLSYPNPTVRRCSRVFVCRCIMSAASRAQSSPSNARPGSAPHYRRDTGRVR
jgi:hypothetical protein